MSNAFSFWQFGNELRNLANVSQDQKWSLAASQLAFVEETRTKCEADSKAAETKRLKNENKTAVGKGKSRHKVEENKLKALNQSSAYENREAGGTCQKSNGILPGNKNMNKKSQAANASDKRFKSLLPSESLPRNEILGGYIFVCNNDTMEEDMKCQLFGLPQRYRDSVRAIQPGLPLFLYNYTTHQLHGVFEAASFGGTNIDPTAWEAKKCKGESRFPAQVRIRVRKLWKPLEEDTFRPVLHHYDGPKFRLQLSVPETLALLDSFAENEFSGKEIGHGQGAFSTPMIYNQKELDRCWLRA